MVASKAEVETAGSEEYKDNHLAKMLREGFSFSGFERDGCYLNLGNKKYRDISGISGIDSESDGRASVFADFDNDGDLDVFVTTIQGEGHLLFRNNVGEANHYLRVALEGRASGRDAAGAVVRVKTGAGTLTKVKAVGNGYLSEHDPRLLFGLGADASSGTIEITWPSGLVQTFDGVAANTSWVAIEGEAVLRAVTERKAKLPDPLRPDEALLAGLHLRPGSPCPDFTLTLLAPGNTAAAALPATTSTRSAFAKGRHLVNLWATWCVPCRKEIPELEARAAALEKAGVRVVGVSLDRRPGAEVGARFAELGGKYPTYLAGEDAAAALYATDEMFVPVSILVEDGIVQAVWGGWTPELRAALERLMAS